MNRLEINVQTGEQRVIELTPDEIAAAQASSAAYEDSIPYTQKRASAYPSIGEQLDLLWHTIDQGQSLDTNSAWYLAIKAVKDQYPKV